MTGEAGGRMPTRIWACWSAASLLLAFGIWWLSEWISQAVAGPGESAWEIPLIVFMIAELPTVLWRRRGGGTPSTLGLAVAMPFAAFIGILIPRNHPEDAYIPFIVLALAGLAFLVGALICLVVRPARFGD
ncbi:MAG: hypothetical protein ABWX67_16195 [Allosphingosinicella sp.]